MVALAVGNNINKLVTPAAVVTFFEINPNLQEGIIISVANFICRQIIGNEILNTSLLRYYFQFINAISYRGMFEDNEALMEKI